MGAASVAAIIINYQSGGLLGPALDGIERQHVGRIIVVDNASTDGSWRPAERPGVELVRCDENIGFARAMNLALGRTTEPFVLMLNADVELGDRYVALLAERLGSDARLAAVTGVLRLPGGGIDSTGVELTTARWAADRGHARREVDMSATPFGVSGAAALVRRSALAEISGGDGPFWPALFVYWEDVEVAWRLRRAGWNFALVERAEAIHARGADRAAPDFVEAAAFGGRLGTIARHEGVVGLVRSGSAFVTAVVGARLAVRHPRALARSGAVSLIRAGLSARREDREHGWLTLEPSTFTPHPWRSWLIAQVRGHGDS